MPKTAAQLDAEIKEFLKKPPADTAPVDDLQIAGVGVLAGAYRGKGALSGRHLLTHGVSHRDINEGRFKRRAGEAFCDRKLNVADSYVYEDASKIDCPKCLEIVDRLRARTVSKEHATMKTSSWPSRSRAPTKSRAHATKHEESIWTEVGLEDASNREKAAFWREALLSDIGDLDAMGVSSALRPVLADISEVVDPEVLRAFTRNQLDSIASSDYRGAVREIREQILNASIGQIVQYANDHYRSLS